MTRYFIKPEGFRYLSLAWAESPTRAKELQKQLQLTTGLKWRIYTKHTDG